MRELPLVRIGLGLMAVIALIALAVNLGERGGGSAAPPTAAASPADPPADADVAEHWRALAPTLVLVDSAIAIRDPERRAEALKAAEDLLERAEERAPGAGELEGSPRREYRRALERLRDAADMAEEPGAGPEAVREVADAR
ncbi:MAG TPA: hypothetical protein VGR37_14045, partial [Longimicrobiaceae bacterium]|nr:hypothetical protein [Longimicrobiaceae bacterium]